MSGQQEQGDRAVPYVCPFCGEEDLRPAAAGRWHCRSCLRLFAVSFFGIAQPGATYPAPQSCTPAPTPASGIRLIDHPLAAPRTGEDSDDDPDEPTPGRIP